MHYNEEKRKYMPVRNKNGGGNRYIVYTDSEPLNLKQLQGKVCELFFPGGRSNFGSLEEMVMCIKILLKK
jgi:hypothetical protein